mmetsp:Transcript_5348/g.15268  ORF Transcript_5348/g.15268 Transcript_5348/m.15268 type:complete len:267 (+) Transcript_5348:1359-2159(+)
MRRPRTAWGELIVSIALTAPPVCPRFKDSIVTAPWLLVHEKVPPWSETEAGRAPNALSHFSSCSSASSQKSCLADGVNSGNPSKSNRAGVDGTSNALGWGLTGERGFLSSARGTSEAGSALVSTREHGKRSPVTEDARDVLACERVLLPSEVAPHAASGAVHVSGAPHSATPTLVRTGDAGGTISTELRKGVSTTATGSALHRLRLGLAEGTSQERGAAGEGKTSLDMPYSSTGMRGVITAEERPEGRRVEGVSGAGDSGRKASVQ